MALSRGRKIVEMAKRNAETKLLPNLPLYETRKKLDANLGELSVEGWNNPSDKKSTEITLEANVEYSCGNFDVNFIDQSFSPDFNSTPTTVQATGQNKKVSSKSNRKRISVLSTSSDNTSFNETLNAEVPLTKPIGNKQEKQKTDISVHKTGRKKKHGKEIIDAGRKQQKTELGASTSSKTSSFLQASSSSFNTSEETIGKGKKGKERIDTGQKRQKKTLDKNTSSKCNSSDQTSLSGYNTSHETETITENENAINVLNKKPNKKTKVSSSSECFSCEDGVPVVRQTTSKGKKQSDLPANKIVENMKKAPRRTYDHAQQQRNVRLERKHQKTNCEQTLENASVSNSDDEQIFVESAKKNEATSRRVYDKRHVCFLCNKRYIKIGRHFENCHKEDFDVVRVLAKPKGSSERKAGFLNLIRAGDFHHNMEVLSSKSGELILVRRPTGNESTNPSEYGPCPACLGFMLKKHLWIHIKKCPDNKSRDNNLKKHVQLESNALLSSILYSNIAEIFRNRILDTMKNDHISFVCRNDTLIVRFGATLYNKHRDTQKDVVRQAMRQLGRLLLTIRESNVKLKAKNLTDLISPQHFDDIVNAVKVLAKERVKEESQRPEHDIPSLAMKIGYSLRKCVGVLKGISLRQENVLNYEKLNRFLELLNIEWSNRISSNAIATLNTRKMNAAQLLPLTSDLLKLNKYIANEISNGTTTLKQCSTNKEVWYNLAQATLARVILFNKRRGGEVSRMFVSQYTSCPNWDQETTQELKNSLSPAEQQLAQELKLIQIHGKRGRTVPVLLTKEMVCAIDVLLETRNSNDIPAENPYVFARAYFGSMHYLRGPDCLRLMVERAELQCPSSIKSTRLRKYIATVSQIFNLQENETDWLARHLGHDIRVHRDYYRLHQSAVELTKVSRLLLAVDEGQADKFSGKSLKDINLNDLPDLESKSDDESAEEDSGEEAGQASGSESSDLGSPDCSKQLQKKGKKAVKVVKKKKIVKHRPWKTEEVKAVTSFFHRDIKNENVPGKAKCTECKEKYKSLDARSWKDVKFYAKNFITRMKAAKKRPILK